MSLLDDDSEYGIGPNFQEQKDELLALESIYSDRPKCFKYDVVQKNGGNSIKGFINVHFPEFQKPITIQKKDSESFEVNFLPPLKLHFEFPHKYPSSLPPVFSLCSSWIGTDLMTSLASALKNAWEEYCGMPILFTWIQILEEEITRNFAKECIVNLDVVVVDSTLCDKSCFSQEPFDAVRQLKEYQEQATQENFERGWYDCEVCFDSHSGSDSIRFSPCGHVFCVGCVSSFYHQRLKDSTVKRLECLTDGCDSFASQLQLQRTLSPDELERYERQLLEGCLDLMSDVVTCPRISCQAPVLLETADENSPQSRSVLPGRCPVCNYTFCVLCKKTYHGLEPCSIDAALREKLLSQYENATAQEKEIIYKRFGGKFNFMRELEAMQSSKWIENNSVHCPRCKVAIEKHSGCNKMVCTKCGQAFCWLCRTLLSSSNPYAHFNMSGSRCFNRLFEGVEMPDEEDEDEEAGWFGIGDVDSSDLED